MSDLTGLPIPRMDWDNTNLPETWRKFQSTVELMFQGPLQPKDEAIKVSYLLLWVGERGREIADTWTDISEEDKKKLAPHYERFRKHVQPKLNPIFSRYKFNLATQGTDTIEQYLTKLETLAKDCNFNDPDEMIRDRIVFGVSEEKAREKLIKVGSDLTLDRAVQIVQTYEYSQIQLKAMKGEVDEVQAKSSFHRPQSNSNRGRHTHRHGNANRQREKAPLQRRDNPSRPQVRDMPGREHRFAKPNFPMGKGECNKCGYHKKVIKTAVQQKENSVRNVKSIIILPDCVNLYML